MQSKLTTIVILVVIVLIASYFILSKEDSVSPDTEAIEEVEEVVQNAGPQEWETITDDQASVTIIVTPIGMLPQSSEWRFNIVMDTHTVELGEDMTEVTLLIDDGGREYKPIGWEGAGPGGHHREGVLSFEAINPVPSSIELKIKDVGGISERSFMWDIE